MRKEVIKRSVRSRVGGACYRRPAGIWRRDAARTAACNDYDRSRDLPALIALWPWEINDLSFEGQQKLVARLRSALRQERQRAIQQHWTYDLARHARLLKAYQCEVANLQAMLGRAGREPRRGSGLGSSSIASSQSRMIRLRDGSRVPSSWQVRNVRQHNSVRPSDNRAEGPTSPDTPRV